MATTHKGSVVQWQKVVEVAAAAVLLLVVAGGGTVGRKPAVGASYDPSSGPKRDESRLGGGRPLTTIDVASVVVVATDTVADPPTMREIDCQEQCDYKCHHEQKIACGWDSGWKDKCQYKCMYTYK